MASLKPVLKASGKLSANSSATVLVILRPVAKGAPNPIRPSAPANIAFSVPVSGFATLLNKSCIVSDANRCPVRRLIGSKTILGTAVKPSTALLKANCPPLFKES